MKDVLLTEKIFFRRQMLVSGIICCLSSLAYFMPNFPFDRRIMVYALGSSLIYFSLFFFFETVKKHYQVILPVVCVLTLTSMGFIVHLSGGIASPFLFLYFVILMSDSTYAVSTPLSLAVAIASLWISVGGEYFGFWPALYPFTLQIYRSPVTTLSFLLFMTAFMFLTSFSMQLIMRNLRAVLADEMSVHEVMLRKFSELNASSHLGVLAHHIVHDLRGPIASISGYIEMELLKHTAGGTHEMLKELQGLVSSIADSLNGITRFGRAPAAVKEKILLGDFFRNIIAIITFSPQARRVRFIKSYSENSHAAVLASRSDLQQVFFNVIKNAVEAVKENNGSKWVQISFALVGGDYEIMISDNGCGMPPVMLANVFKKSITTKQSGTGVGLIITRDLLDRNDGTIELRNREGGGATVVIRLPVA